MTRTSSQTLMSGPNDAFMLPLPGLVLHHHQRAGPKVEHAQMFAHWARLELLRQRIRRDPRRRDYMDRALTPVTDNEEETLEMFTHNEAARSEVERTRRIAGLTHGAPAHVPPPAAAQSQAPA